MTKHLVALFGLLLVAGVVRAEEPAPTGIKVKVFEPPEGAAITRRHLTVIAHVDSGAKTVTAEVVPEGQADEEREKAVALLPVKNAAGRYQGTLESPSSGKFTLHVRAIDAHGKASHQTVNLESKRGLRAYEVLAPGSPAPAATAKSLKGEDVSLDSAKGPVLVHFYSAWDDCELELKWLAALAKKYEKLTIVGVASVNAGDHDKWAKYLEKNKVTWQNVADPDGAIAKKWNDCGHEVAGSQTNACVTYVMHDGKIAGGDLIAWDYVGKLDQTATEEALAKIFP